MEGELLGFKKGAAGFLEIAKLRWIVLDDDGWETFEIAL